MTKKEVLRRVLEILSYLAIIILTIGFFLGKVDIISSIIIFIDWFLLILNILISIIDKIQVYFLYKLYKDDLQYLKYIQKERYKLYFTGSKEKIQEYSDEIERYGTNLIASIESAISKGIFNKKYLPKLEEIIEQSKTLMTTIK